MASSIKENLKSVLARIENAAKAAGRPPNDIKLVAATKTQSIEQIAEYKEACRFLGVQPICGENYVQELVEKSRIFPEIEWHFIGRLQRNKAALVVQSASLIQSVGSVKVLQAINEQALRQKTRTQILLQINISKDPAKDGFLPSELEVIAVERGTAAWLEVCGVMTILEYGLDSTKRQLFYSQMCSLAADLKCRGTIDQTPAQISMGMSDDFDVAIMAGATIVRVGTAIFGQRQSITN